MGLPTAKTEAQPRIGRVFAYAIPKIGKSTLFSTLDPEHTLLIDCEDGLSAIEGYKHPVTSWGKVAEIRGEGRAARPIYDEHSLLGVGALLHQHRQEALAEGKRPQFRVGVVDTADALSTMCADYVLQQLGLGAERAGQFVHASDFDFGKGWAAITEEWKTRMSALSRVLDSVILIGHAKRRSATTRTGAEYDVFTPELGPSGLREWTLGWADHILFMHMIEHEGEQVRAVRTKQALGWEAGGRTAINGAKLPDPILLPDAATSGETLRLALESIIVKPETPATAEDLGEVDGAPEVQEPVKKPAAAKTKAAAKPAASKSAAAPKKAPDLMEALQESLEPKETKTDG